jgi:hypothetical protein
MDIPVDALTSDRPRPLRRRLQVRHALVLSGLVMAWVSVAAVPAEAAPGAAHPARVSFGVEPASAQRPDGQPDFAFGVTPGAIVPDHVAVLNFSTKPLSLQLYATDAVNTASGGFGLLPANVRPVGAGAWVTLPRSSATVRVPARTAKRPGQVIVPFVLKVPDTASPGDHAGGIVASLRTVGHNASGQTVVLEQRVGSRLFVRVAGQLRPGLGITNLHADYHGAGNPFGAGRVSVSYRLTNTGNVEYGLVRGVHVGGLVGAGQQVNLASIPLLLPGDSLVETATVHHVWPQFLDRVTVTAKPVAAPGEPSPALGAVTARTRVLALPWLLLILIVAAGVAVSLGYRARRRSGGSGEPAERPERVSA